MKAIAIATTEKGKCLPVLAASITFYVPQDVPVFLAGSDIIFPRHRTVNMPNDATNFGDAYNAVVKRAFEEVDEVVVCNDDIVFNPTTWKLLGEDVAFLRDKSIPLGWASARSDYARGLQNIRLGQGKMEWFRYETENLINITDVIAPICSYISKEAWVDFPPINWYSDDVQCLDIQKKGFQHAISRAYVHHVGSQTCGFNAKELIQSAQPWIKANRPELYDLWFRKTD
jgi:hypothetical protein